MSLQTQSLQTSSEQSHLWTDASHVCTDGRWRRVVTMPHYSEMIAAVVGAVQNDQDLLAPS